MIHCASRCYLSLGEHIISNFELSPVYDFIFSFWRLSAYTFTFDKSAFLPFRCLVRPIGGRCVEIS